MFQKLRAISFIFYTGVLVLRCNGTEEGNEQISSEDYETVLEEQSKLPMNTDEFDMENGIRNIESLGLIAEQMNKVQDFITETDIENFYNYMIQAVDRVQNAIRYSDNVYKFIKANGVLRILSNNLTNTNVKLRIKLLLLLKDIFDTAPTVDALLPLNIADRLIDIFENDKNLALKAHALDVLYKWLPNNPQAQIRIMKISGLETFYEQIDKLDIGVVKTLMELFNKILEEHLEARNDEEMVNEVDGDKVKMYKSIGIIERLSTPKVCNGLLNIFEILWSYNRNESDNIKIILDLITKVKPFCVKFYKKKHKAIKLFEDLLKFVTNEDKKEYLEKLDVNATDIAVIIKEYMKKELNNVVVAAKDEF